MTIALIAAEAFELESLLKRISNPFNPGLPVRFARVGKWNQTQVICAADGAGPGAAERAAGLVIEKYRPDALWSVGLCGALDHRLGFSDVVVATEVLDHPRGDRFRCTAEGWETGNGVVVVSQDRIALTSREKESLRSYGSIVEMEAAGVARAAEAAGVRFGCVKVVSDTAAESFSIDLNAARDGSGRISPWRVVREALRRPAAGVRELFGLWRKSRVAAARLGEFLGDCRV